MTAPVRAGADLRLLRAAVFAAVCVTLSAAGHEMASDGPIPVWALLAGWAAVLTVAALLAGRERSLPGIAALMLCGQLALHLLFSVGQCLAAPAAAKGSGASGRLAVPVPDPAALLVRRAGVDPSSAASVLPAQASSGAHGMADMPGMPGMSAMSNASGMHSCMMLTWPMICGHLAAALIAGWLLWRGEAALWRMVRLPVRGAEHVTALFALHTALATVRALALVVVLLAERLTGTGGRPATGDLARPRAVQLLHSVIRRGPPVMVLAA